MCLVGANCTPLSVDVSEVSGCYEPIELLREVSRHSYIIEVSVGVCNSNSSALYCSIIEFTFSVCQMCTKSVVVIRTGSPISKQKSPFANFIDPVISQ